MDGVAPIAPAIADTLAETDEAVGMILYVSVGWLPPASKTDTKRTGCSPAGVGWTGIRTVTRTESSLLALAAFTARRKAGPAAVTPTGGVVSESIWVLTCTGPEEGAVTVTTAPLLATESVRPDAIVAVSLNAVADTTKTLALPDFPSLVAVSAATPTPLAVAKPVVLTTTTLVSLAVQLTARPVSGPPAESFIAAASSSVWPTYTLAVAGVTATLATGTGRITSVTVPVFPSIVAVSVTVPTARVATRPVPEIVARVVSPEVQLIARPKSGTPPASLGVAVSCTVCDTRTVSAVAVTTTLATGTGVTVTLAVPCTVPAAAVIVAVPAFNAVTVPPLTVATVASFDVHVILSLSKAPEASFARAVRAPVCPI